MVKKYPGISLCILGFLSITLGIASDAFAADELSKGRIIWNNIMLWVNFGILVFFFMKYAKKPLINFLTGEKEKVESELNNVNTQLAQAKSIMEAEAENLKNIEGRLQDIRENIIGMAQREKEKLLHEAKLAADQMIDDANKESRYKLTLAKKMINDEMVDIAVSMVEDRLKKGISVKENSELVNQFISGLDAEDINR
ncbi:hypothetical protein ACFL9T_03220 [Thermodesulfobacteriota bacterium]